jgi:hypothetical protein
MARRTRRFTYPHVMIALAIFAGFWAMCGFIVAVDPLDVYPWGPTPKVDANADVDGQLELLLPRSVDPDADMLILGDSTSRIYTADFVRSQIPGVRNPVNLSYGYPQLGDTEMLLQRIARRSKARWMILFVGPSYLTPIDSMRAGAPVYLLNGTAFDDMRYVNAQSAMLALNVVRGRPLYGARSAPLPVGDARDTKMAGFQTPGAMRDLGKRLADSQGKLASQPMAADCSGQIGVNRVLAPFLRTMSERGVRVDLVFTPTSRAVYGQVVEDPSAIKLYPANMFAGESTLQKCLVLAADGLPHVAVHGFDDDWIVGDLANYKDTAHLWSAKIAQYIMREVASGGHVITPATVDRYIADFRSKTIAFRGYNSNFPEMRWP